MLADQLEEHEKRLHELQQHMIVNHRKALKSQENKFLELLQQEKTESVKREEQLKDELEFVKKSFHTFKVNI